MPRFMELLAQHRISRLVLVPTLLRAMLEVAPDLGRRLPDLKHWISSGEALPADLVLAFRRAAPGRRLINLYGSSEVAGDVTWYDTADMPENAILPASLGWPIDNCSVCLLDSGGRPVPDGMPGELWIGGTNLADGYHGMADLSAGAFVPNPFGDGMLFRSRDWGRREVDGSITFLGRQDGQVKIRGMRVDLGEVEAAMREVEAVQAAVDLNRPGADGRARIVGWYVGTASPDEYRMALEQKLPRYMVPAALIALEAIPLLPNGKVDRRSLPDPNETGQSAEETVVALQTETETALAAIWADVLDVPLSMIGRTQNYFHLGGDSISAIRVATRATAAGLSITVRDVFESQTLAALAERMEGAGTQRMQPVALGRDFPDIAPVHWRQFTLVLEGDVTEAKVWHSVGQIVATHEMLRGRILFNEDGAEITFAPGPDVSRTGEPVFIANTGIFSVRKKDSSGRSSAAHGYGGMVHHHLRSSPQPRRPSCCAPCTSPFKAAAGDPRGAAPGCRGRHQLADRAS